MSVKSLGILAVALALGSPFVAACDKTGAQQQQTTTPPPAAQPDNTAQNKQPGVTADQQSQSESDLALVQRIRAAILKDSTLSIDAQNCKVVTNGGKVWLRGPVGSDKEKQAVNSIAVQIAGAGQVTNELVVK
jgi:osmotically-inducible protein OsmY